MAKQPQLLATRATGVVNTVQLTQEMLDRIKSAIGHTVAMDTKRQRLDMLRAELKEAEAFVHSHREAYEGDLQTLWEAVKPQLAKTNDTEAVFALDGYALVIGFGPDNTHRSRIYKSGV